MALVYVGYSSAATTSVALPAFVAGDMAVVFAYRDGSATVPSLPAGWTDIASSGADLNSSRIGYRVLQAGDTTTGVWTNATEVQVLLLRGQHLTTPIGSYVAVNGLNSDFVTYNPVRIFGDPIRSWVVAFAGSRTATDVRSRTATAMANRSSLGAGLSLSCHTQAAGFTLYPDTGENWFDARSFIVNATSAWRSYAIEIQEFTANQTQTATAVVALAPALPPNDRNNHFVWVRARKTNAAHTGVIRVQLFESGAPRSAVLSTPALTTTLANYALPISEGEALQIGTYAELSLRFNGYSSEGTPTVFEVDQVWLATPVGSTTVNPIFPNTLMCSMIESWAAPPAPDTSIYPSPTLYPSELEGGDPVGPTSVFPSTTIYPSETSP